MKTKNVIVHDENNPSIWCELEVDADNPTSPIFRPYQCKQIAEIGDWIPGMDMTGVSISDVDKSKGSPKLGDMIARNPKNHDDKWLISFDYFKENFEVVSVQVG